MRQLATLIFCFAVANSLLVEPDLLLQLKRTLKEDNDAADVGEPLFLTPLIEAGKIKEAQEKSAVSDSIFGNVKSFSGYLTVNKAFKSNLYFWFFPAGNGDKDAPVLLYLDGGPGVSSLASLFFSNGPFVLINGEKVIPREHSWHKNYSVLFIDNPAGTGYSFTSDDGYCRNQTQVGEELYNGMYQFFQLFPELQKNDFYITGLSYAGKYVPALGYTIHTKNPSAQIKINLKGLVIASGLIDLRYQNDYAEYLYQTGMIDIHVKNVTKHYQQDMIHFIDTGLYKNASDMFYKILGYTREQSGLQQSQNYLDDGNPALQPFYDLADYTDRSDVRRALHVGNSTFHLFIEVFEALHDDVPQSTATWLGELLSHYRVLMFNGQLDIIVAYPLTENLLRNLKFSAANDYKTAKRKIWRFNDKPAGYVKTAGNLTEVLVRNAGHSVIGAQPEKSLDLLNRFIKNLPIAD